MGVLSPPFDTFETLHLGENQFQQPRPGLQQVESYRDGTGERRTILLSSTAMRSRETMPIRSLLRTIASKVSGEEPEIQLRSEGHRPASSAADHPKR